MLYCETYCTFLECSPVANYPSQEACMPIRTFGLRQSFWGVIKLLRFFKLNRIRVAQAKLVPKCLKSRNKFRSLYSSWITLCFLACHLS